MTTRSRLLDRIWSGLTRRASFLARRSALLLADAADAMERPNRCAICGDARGYRFFGEAASRCETCRRYSERAS